ncbi:MAG: alpha/beta hydrolase [Myxococcales bacterium]|nr:alpha/beta hydrolase [Myxococcales bacterium]
MRRSLLALGVLGLAACGSGSGGAATSSSGAASTAPSSGAPSAPGTAHTTASSSAAATGDDHSAAARAFVELLARGAWDEALVRVGAQARAALDAGKLAEGWKAAVGAHGPFVAVRGSDREVRGDREVVTVHVELAKGTMDVRVGFAGSAEVAMLRASPAEGAWEPPAYVDASKLEAREVAVGAPDRALPGTLTLPKGAGPSAVVLLVHGSGPGDRDDSVGPTRPFRDLAHGLASRGVAVLRWEKRTRDQAYLAAIHVSPADVTVKEEYLDDFAAAVAFAKETPGLDRKRIFVAGHSQGGWLVPWLLRDHPELSGGIVLAGHARPFASILPKQIEYLGKLATGGQDDPRLGAQLELVKRQCALALDPKLAPDTPATDLPLGVPAKYWLSLQGYDAVATAKALRHPLLILQGGRDYQVTEADDLELWKKGLAGRQDVVQKLYPKLNHAFFAGEGMATPTEYETVAGHVDAAVVEDIAAFVGKYGGENR